MQTNSTRVILVRHGEVDANRRYACLGRRDDELNARGLDPATISVVDRSATPVVRLVNSHGHLGFSNARWMKPE